MDTPRTGAAVAERRSHPEAALLRGVLGAVLCALALGSLWTVTVPAYWPVDELSHVAYARTIADGELPTISTPIGNRGVPGLRERVAYERATGNDDRLDIWTANHPPLFYLLAAVPLAGGAAAGALDLGFLGARGVAVLAAAAGVALTAALARVLVPGRPEIAVAAAAFAALTPSLGHFAGAVFNDSTSFALCTLLLLTAALVLRDGPGGRRVAVVGLAGAAAALTRVASLPLVALATAAAAAAAWRAAGRAPGGGSGTRGRPRSAAALRPRAAAALRAGAVAGGLPALGAGWFYLRSWQRYGDLTGSEALLEKFGREPHAPLGALLTDGGFYLGQWDRLLADLSTGVWTEGWRVLLLRSLGAAVLVGLALGLGRWARTRRSAEASPARPAWWGDRGWRVWGWLAALAFPATLVLATARFHSRGGTAHARYLLSSLAVIALVAVVGWAQLGRRGRAWPLLGGVGGMAVLSLGAWLEFLQRGAALWVLDGEVHHLRAVAEGWARPAAGVAVLVLAVGLLLVARALVELARTPRLTRTRG